MLKTAAVNEPRFEKEGLLIEGQSTNLWPTQNNTSALNTMNAAQESVTLPTGVSGNAYKVTPSATDFSYVRISPSQQTGPHTLSCFARKADGSEGMPTLYTGHSGALNVKANGVYVGAGWWRMSALLTNPVGNTGFGFAPSSLAPIPVHICFFQLEALPFATSYIPTNGAAVTRAADVCFIPERQNIYSGGTDVSFCCEVDTKGGSNRIFEAGDATLFGINESGFSGRVSQIAIKPILTSYILGSRAIVAASISPARVTSRLNGIVVSGVPSKEGSAAVARLQFGNRSWSLDRPLNGHIRNFRIWHSALTDEQIKALK